MKVLLALCATTLTAALPKASMTPVALKVRGGELTTVTKVGAGLFGASGAAAYISPKGNFKAYDMDVTEASALSVMRCVGAWQMVLAALVTADTGDVHSLGSYLAAASILVAIPAWEVLGAPKEPNVAWMGFLTYLATRADLDATRDRLDAHARLIESLEEERAHLLERGDRKSVV